MQDIAELERRITTALNRISAGIDALPAAGVADRSPPDQQFGDAQPAMPDKTDLDHLAEALDEERMLTAQLHERLRVVKVQEAQSRSALEDQIDQMTRQMDVQGLELQRMRTTVVQLRESLRGLTDGQLRDVTDPQLINKAMQAELDALRATRFAELAEMDEILAALDPLIADAPDEKETADA